MKVKIINKSAKFIFLMLTGLLFSTVFSQKSNAQTAYNQTLLLSNVPECKNDILTNIYGQTCLQAAIDMLNSTSINKNYSTLDLQGKEFTINNTIYFRYKTSQVYPTPAQLAKPKGDSNLKKIQNGTLTCGSGFTQYDMPSYAISLDGIYCDDAKFSTCNSTTYNNQTLPRMANKYLDNITINANDNCSGIHLSANYYNVGLRRVNIKNPRYFGVRDIKENIPDSGSGHILAIFDSTFTKNTPKKDANVIAIKTDSADYLFHNNIITGFNIGIVTSTVGQIQENTINLTNPVAAISYNLSTLITDNTLTNGNIVLTPPPAGPPNYYSYKNIHGGTLVNNTISAPLIKPNTPIIQLNGTNLNKYKKIIIEMMNVKDNKYNNSPTAELVSPFLPMLNATAEITLNDIYLTNNISTARDQNAASQDNGTFWLNSKQLIQPFLDQGGSPGKATEFIYSLKGMLSKNCTTIRLDEIYFPTNINNVNEQVAINNIGWSVSKFNENNSGTLSLKLRAPLAINQHNWVPYFRVKVACNLLP